MPIAPGAEPHMVALANQADAANRPRWIIAFGALVAITCAIIAGIGVTRLLSARVGYNTAEAQLVQAEQFTTTIKRTRAEQPSLEDLYPPAGLMFNHVEDTLQRVWGLDRNASYQSFATVQRLARDNLLTITSLGKANIECVIRNQPLDKILAFVETTLAHEAMQNAFISTFELEPTANGWSAVIEFRRYEVVR